MQKIKTFLLTYQKDLLIFLLSLAFIAMSVALLVRLPGRSESLSILSQSGIVKFSDDLHLDYLPKTDISTAELEALSVFSSVGYTVTIKE